MRHCLEALLGLTILLAPVPAAAQALPPAPAMTAEQQRQTAWATERGRLLFALDRAAWVGTDDALERIPNADTANLIGYIVDRAPDGQLATIFFGEEGGQLVAAYRGKVGPAGIVSREVFRPSQRPLLSEGQRRLARAMQQFRAMSVELSMCADARPNIAIVPPATPDGPIDIYVMTPPVEADVLPFGGHHRFTLGPDGAVLNRRAFTNGCLNVETDNDAISLVVSHLLDPHPTEIHMFSALALGKPVYVSTERILWKVDAGGIRLLASNDDVAASPPQQGD